VPIPKAIDSIPSEVRAKIDQWLHSHGYADYDGLVEMLASQGYELSRTVLGRYGKNLKEKTEKIRQATQMTTELLAALGDDANNLGLASVAMAQQSIFDALASSELNLEGMSERERTSVLLKLYRVLPSLSAGFARQDKRRAEIVQLEKMTAEVTKGGNKNNLDLNTLEVIRRELYGLD